MLTSNGPVKKSAESVLRSESMVEKIVKEIGFEAGLKE